jgi:hypothetical protein
MFVLVIDLEKKKAQLNETYDEALGWWTKQLLRYMYGDDVNMIANLNEEEEVTAKFKITGEYEDVKAYATAVARQKDYLDAYIEFGKGHPQTIKAEGFLTNASREFESLTGLRWPFTTEG